MRFLVHVDIMCLQLLVFCNPLCVCVGVWVCVCGCGCGCGCVGVFAVYMYVVCVASEDQPISEHNSNCSAI